MKGGFYEEIRGWAEIEEMSGTELIITKYQQVTVRWSLHLQVRNIQSGIELRFTA
jgi:hypothetical protein